MFKDNEFQVASSLCMHLRLRMPHKVKGLTAGQIESNAFFPVSRV